MFIPYHKSTQMTIRHETPMNHSHSLFLLFHKQTYEKSPMKNKIHNTPHRNCITFPKQYKYKIFHSNYILLKRQE